MANNEKLLRGNVTILLAYPEAFADPSQPTAAELNDQFVYTTNEDAMVFNVSPATLDDYTMNMSEPETDDTLTVVDVGNVSTATYDNYEVSLDFLRDASVTANGAFNLGRDLTLTPDREFYAIKRIGKGQTDTFLTDGTDVISIFGVKTDLPIDMVEDNSMLKHGARFKNTGELYVNVAVTS